MGQAKTVVTRTKLRFTTVAETSMPELVDLVRYVSSLTEAEDGEDPELYLQWIIQHGMRYSESASLKLTEEALQTTRSITGEQLVHLMTALSDRRPATAPVEYLPPHQVYLAFDEVTNHLAAIAGFVPDDRGVGKSMDLVNKDPHWIGFFGGQNVRRDQRGRQIGPLI